MLRGGGGAELKGSLERAVPPRPSTSTLFKILTLICLVLHEESNSFLN